MNTPLPAICLAGPTGAGKTAAALYLASHVHGEVINTDSRQVYCDFPIITAQPSPEEQSHCPHHLYGFLPTSEKLSAGRFADKVMEVAKDVVTRGKIPILVGGTGLYFKALLEGIAPIPAIAEDISADLLARCTAVGSPVLHKELCRIDPDYAAKIHPNDKQRVVRALEVYTATGKNFTWWHKHAIPEPLLTGPYLGMDITLAALRPRLDARIELMLKAGALEEATKALEKCANGKAPGWSGIGCAELFAHLHQGRDFTQTLELWRKNTRAYAKRQLTWFKAVPSMQWFAPDDVQGMVTAVKGFFAKQTS